MIGLGNSVRTFGFVTILLAVTTAAIAFGFVRSSIDDIRNHWQQNLLWPSSQLEIEYLRFREVLIRFGRADPQVTRRDVNKRFDILWSRVNLFEQGDTREKISNLPLAEQTISALLQTLLEQEPIVVGLRDGEFAKSIKILAAFEAHEKTLRQFNRRVMRGEVAHGFDLRDDLNVNQTLLAWLGAGAVIVSLLLLAYFASESRRQRGIAIENKKLLELARSGSRAKTAFLSMMSHDLRTPMNGISGMIALARRHASVAQQTDMLDQAADSSEQMNSLLTDILDFAELEESNLELKNRPFRPEELAQEIMDELALSARREELDFSIKVANNCPPQLIGDKRRLCQTTVHLAQFLAQNSGKKAVVIDLFYGDGFLQVQLAFHYDLKLEGWNPELVLGASRGQDSEFTDDALGPAIARGFTKSMGGELFLQMAENGQDSGQVLLVIPLVEYEAANVVVRIETQSAALAAICKGAINLRHVQFFERGSSAQVDTVIIEAGSDFERETCQTLRKTHPTAHIIALGAPADQSLFDGLIELPINIEALRKAPFLQR